MRAGTGAPWEQVAEFATFFVNRVVKILPCCTALHKGQICRASRHSRNGGQRATISDRLALAVAILG